MTLSNFFGIWLYLQVNVVNVDSVIASVLLCDMYRRLRDQTRGFHAGGRYVKCHSRSDNKNINIFYNTNGGHLEIDLSLSLRSQTRDFRGRAIYEIINKTYRDTSASRETSSTKKFTVPVVVLPFPLYCSLHQKRTSRIRVSQPRIIRC